MLKVLRKKGVAKKVLGVITFFIVISFAMWGGYSNTDNGRPTYAGKVYGKKISVQEYQHSFEMTRIQAMMQYGTNFNKVSQFLNLESQSWDRIILLMEAKRRNIKISDQEVITAINSLPIFQRDGKIDPLRYNDMLRYVFRIKPRDFEEGIRDHLKLAKLYAQETNDIKASEEDAFEAYRHEKEKIKVSYALISDDTYKAQVPVDEAKIKEYYTSHLKEFVLPLMINVQSVRFDVPHDKTPAAKEAKSATETQTKDTTAGEDNQPSGSEEERKAAMQKALAFLKEAKESKTDFIQTAQSAKLEVEESGLFSMEQPILKSGWSFAVVEKLFNLEAGDFTGPVETPDGFQVLRIKEKKASATPSYEEAKDKVKEAYLKSEAHKIAKEKAKEYLTKILEQFQSFKNPDFAQIAKGLGLEIEQTPLFGRGQYLPKIGVSRNFQDEAFELTDTDRLSSKTIETAKGFCLIHLDSRETASKEEFAKEKDNFVAAFLEQKRNEMFSNFITHLRIKANLEDHVAELMKS